MFQRFILVFVVCLLFSPEVLSQKGLKIRTVVIDAGHGGKDPGAVGKNSKEKNITLDVALRTGKYIKQNLPDVTVIYTRTKDEFIELHRRAGIANEANADIFISIHCNAVANSTVIGAETFVMGEHKSEANLEVAKLENAAILLEENADSEYGGFDPNSTPAYIAFTLYQSEYKQQSISLAQSVQEQFTKRAGRKDRSVQQAGFLVLYRTAMPSILVELGFLSNPKEEAFLLSESGRSFMAQCIYRAFKDFKSKYERDNATTPWAVTEEKTETIQNKTIVQTKEIPVDKTEDTPKEQTTVKPAGKPMEVPKTKVEKADIQGLVYKVQFYTNSKKLEFTDKRFSEIEDIGLYFHNGLFKYTSGSFTDLKKATAHQNLMRSGNFPDAFVVAFQKGERISMDDALKLGN
jgi:N-acetylmuramoyl-L-alanine amidase